MADTPYNLDFLTKITNVNFAGGMWAVSAGFAVDPGGTASGHAEVDFKQQAGGSPGFIMINGTVPLGGPNKKTFAKADYQNRLITGAGLGMKGFLMSDKNSRPAAFNLQQIIFLPTQPLFAQPFQFQGYLDCNGRVGFENAVMVVSVWKKSVPVGTTYDISGDIPTGTLPPPDGQDSFFGNSSNIDEQGITATFSIDLKKGTVSHTTP